MRDRWPLRSSTTSLDVALNRCPFLTYIIQMVELSQSPSHEKALGFFFITHRKGIPSMMNTTDKPAWSARSHRRAANSNSNSTRHGKVSIAAASILFASLSGQALATPNCSAYIPVINKQLASYLTTVGPREMKNVSLDEFGNMVDPIWGRPVVKLNTYALPESISKKLSYRFTDAATKGVRTANGRTVCNFSYEANDGFKIEKGYANFDVEPFSKASEVVMYVSPGEAKSGVQFTPEGFAQMIINSTVRKSLASDPQYKGKFNVAF